MSEDFKYNEGVKTRQEHDLKEPSMYKVVLLNDHYTTMEFVVEVIKTVFHKTAAEATRIMMDVHKKGRGVVGSYAFDVARTKAEQVEQMARENEYPLRCTIEED